MITIEKLQEITNDAIISKTNGACAICKSKNSKYYIYTRLQGSCDSWIVLFCKRHHEGYLQSHFIGEELDEKALFYLQIVGKI